MRDLSLRTADGPGSAACGKADSRWGMRLFWALLAGAILFASPAPLRADCMRDIEGRVVCDRGQCVRDLYGKVTCARTEDGAALVTLYGEVVCGKGRCVTTLKGDIICAVRPGGAAMTDLYGKVTCDGGCEEASPGLCGQNSDTVQ